MVRQNIDRFPQSKKEFFSYQTDLAQFKKLWIEKLQSRRSDKFLDISSQHKTMIKLCILMSRKYVNYSCIVFWMKWLQKTQQLLSTWIIKLLHTYYHINAFCHECAQNKIGASIFLSSLIILKWILYNGPVLETPSLLVAVASPCSLCDDQSGLRRICNLE